MDVKQMNEKRARLLVEAKAILDRAERDGRDLNSDEDSTWTKLHAEADTLYSLAERRAKQESVERRELEREETERLDREHRAGRIGPDTAEQRKMAYASAFGAWMRGGFGPLNPEQRAQLHTGHRELDQAEIAALGAELRVLGTDASGTPFAGFTIPEDFRAEIETAMLQFNAMLRTRAAGSAFTTSTGAAMPWPTVNDTTNKGELLAEGTGAGEQDVVFGRTVFDAFTYTSKLVRVQLQLIQDSAFDLGAYLAQVFGERLGRITSEHMFTGTGTAQPRGIVTAAVDSNVTFGIAAGQLADASVAVGKLIDIQHSVESAYRSDGEWLMHDDALKDIRKLKDTTNQPIWNSGVAGGAPSTILGAPYVTDPEMPDTGTIGNKALVFGDMSKYKIRRVKDMTILRLEERYAEFLQVGFLAFLRLDGDLLNAGTDPVKFSDMVT